MEADCLSGSFFGAQLLSKASAFFFVIEALVNIPKCKKSRGPHDLQDLLERMGWEMGLEPTTTGITIRDSTN